MKLHIIGIMKKATVYDAQGNCIAQIKQGLISEYQTKIIQHNQVCYSVEKEVNRICIKKDTKLIGTGTLEYQEQASKISKYIKLPLVSRFLLKLDQQSIEFYQSEQRLIKVYEHEELLCEIDNILTLKKVITLKKEHIDSLLPFILYGVIAYYIANDNHLQTV